MATAGLGEAVAAAPVKRQLSSIQVARGIAALAVVAFHATNIETKYFQVDILPPFLEGGMVGVDLFFVISGFVMVLTTRGRHGKPREAGGFLWNRFFRIYPTYWVYALALIPVLILEPTFINSSQGGRVNILASFLLLPSDTLPILLVAWTLTLEVWFYLVFAIVLLLPQRWLVPALGLWMLVLVLLNGNGHLSTVPLLQVPANSMAIEFILGGAAALLYTRVNRILAAVLAVGGVVVLATIGTATTIDIYAGPGLVRPLTLGLGFALLLLAVTAFENRGGIGVVSRLSILGDMSYSVYLCHVLVLSVTGRVWQALAGPFATSLPATIVYWALSFAAVLVTGYLSYRLIERPVMGLSKRWRRSVFAERTTKAGSALADPAPRVRETSER